MIGPGRAQLRLLVERWTPTVVVMFVFTKALQGLRRLGVKPAEDGWRRATRAYFRDEWARFALSALGLQLPKDSLPGGDEQCRARFFERLAAFLDRYPDTHWRLQWTTFSVKPVRKTETDLTEAQFDPDGRLVSLNPHLDLRCPLPLPPAIRDAVIHGLIQSYNGTLRLGGKRRPSALERRMGRLLAVLPGLKKADQKGAAAYAGRVLSSTFVHFESHSDVDEIGRFEPPDFGRARHPGQGMLNICCRVNSSCGTVDLWVESSHIPLDGMAIQDVLSDLKREWGGAGRLQNPAVSSEVEPLMVKAGPDLFRVIDRIDFRPLLADRKRLNEQYRQVAGGEITILSLLAWGLARRPCFSDVKFLFPIDLAACGARERTVGLVFIRPSRYFDAKNPVDGFLRYQRELNRRLNQTRARRSESYELTESFALLPPVLYTAAFKLMPKAVGDLIGTVGLSIIKDADIFLGPVSDVHRAGFLAFGDFQVPTSDGGMAGAVSATGSRAWALESIRAVREVAEGLIG